MTVLDITEKVSTYTSFFILQDIKRLVNTVIKGYSTKVDIRYSRVTHVLRDIIPPFSLETTRNSMNLSFLTKCREING